MCKAKAFFEMCKYLSWCLSGCLSVCITHILCTLTPFDIELWKVKFGDSVWEGELLRGWTCNCEAGLGRFSLFATHGQTADTVWHRAISFAMIAWKENFWHCIRMWVGRHLPVGASESLVCSWAEMHNYGPWYSAKYLGIIAAIHLLGWAYKE